MTSPTRFKIAFVAPFLAGIGIFSVAQAQHITGEHRDRCVGRDVVVWSSAKNIKLYPGQSNDVFVNRGSEIVWFCGGTRRSFYCVDSDRVNLVAVTWHSSGEIVFQCKSN